MRAPMTWRELELVHALARHGTMRAAGAALGLNHATLSRRLAVLEARLGTPLLSRAGRGVALTPAGVRLAETAARMDAARTAPGPDAEWVGLRAPSAVWPAIARGIAAAQGGWPSLRIQPGADVVVHLSQPLDTPAEPVGSWVLTPVGPADRGWIACPGAHRDAWRQQHLRAPIVARVESELQAHALATAGVGAGLLPPHLAKGVPVVTDLPPLHGTLWMVCSNRPAAARLGQHVRATLAG